jgi:hypothetical protein
MMPQPVKILFVDHSWLFLVFFAQRRKKALVKGLSPLQELEVGQGTV